MVLRYGKGTPLYTTVERRTINRARLQETVRRAQTELFPALQRAPGFIGFWLVSDAGGEVFSLPSGERHATVRVVGDNGEAYLRAVVDGRWTDDLLGLPACPITDVPRQSALGGRQIGKSQKEHVKARGSTWPGGRAGLVVPSDVLRIPWYASPTASGVPRGGCDEGITRQQWAPR